MFKYHEVEALSCKMSPHLENWAQMQCLYTQNANSQSQFWEQILY